MLRAYRKSYLEYPLLLIQRALPAEFNRKVEGGGGFSMMEMSKTLQNDK